jgi:hypothetical protein
MIVIGRDTIAVRHFLTVPLVSGRAADGARPEARFFRQPRFRFHLMFCAALWSCLQVQGERREEGPSNWRRGPYAELGCAYKQRESSVVSPTSSRRSWQLPALNPSQLASRSDKDNQGLWRPIDDADADVGGNALWM